MADTNFLARHYTTAASYTPNGANGDKLVLTPATPAIIVRWGVICGTTAVDTGTVTFTGDKRVSAGSDSGRVDGATSGTVPTHTDVAGGTFAATAAQLALGKGVYHEVRGQPQTGGETASYSGSHFGLLIIPGQEFVIEQTAETLGAGSLIPFVEWYSLPFVKGSDTTASNMLANMTRV